MKSHMVLVPPLQPVLIVVRDKEGQELKEQDSEGTWQLLGRNKPKYD